MYYLIYCNRYKPSISKKNNSTFQEGFIQKYLKFSFFQLLTIGTLTLFTIGAVTAALGLGGQKAPLPKVFYKFSITTKFDSYTLRKEY